MSATQIETVDLSEYSQAKSAAKAVRNTIRQIADDFGQSPDVEVTLKEEGDSYVLYWEGGFSNWAVDALGGSGLVGSHIEGQLDYDDSMWVEAKYSFALEFGNY